jgi:hypothetical protein
MSGRGDPERRRRRTLARDRAEDALARRRHAQFTGLYRAQLRNAGPKRTTARARATAALARRHPAEFTQLYRAELKTVAKEMGR